MPVRYDPETLTETRSARPGRGRGRARGVLLLLLVAGLTSCQSYTRRTEHAVAAFERGQLDAARQAYRDPDTTANSSFLGAAEAGMVSFTMGDWDAALEELSAAAAVVRDLEDRALVSAEKLGKSLLSWTVNEGWVDYQGEGYERVMLHACLAQVYLALGNLDSVFVETRRSNRLLETEEELYEKEYKAGGLGHFLSAVTYELLDKPDEAYIDYVRMHEKGVGTELAGRALVRLAAATRHPDLDRWVELYGPDSERPEDAASIVLIAGVGLGPYKKEHTLTLPSKKGLLQWSVPSSERRPQGIASVTLRTAGSGTGVRTSVLEDVAHTARENLEDRIAWLAAKSTVRAFLKRDLTRNLEKEHGLGGRIVGDLFTLATERADLRAWLTLPDTWQGARLFVAPGRHEVIVSAGGRDVRLGTYELEPGETMFVLTRTVGPHVYAHPIGGGLVEDVETQTTGEGLQAEL